MDLKVASIAEFFQDRVSEAIRNQGVDADRRAHSP